MPLPKMPLRVVIVGGVAGGMSAATRLRRLDETAMITVFEKGLYVSCATSGLPYCLGGVIKDDSALTLQTAESFKALFNIDVYVNTEVVDIDRKGRVVTVQPLGGGEGSSQFFYDKLILSQGAEPFRPSIEGSDLHHVFTFQTIPDLRTIRHFMLEHEVRHVAIVGGGFIGLETAEALNHIDREVTIIEYMPQVFPPIDEDMVGFLHTEIRRHDVRLLLNTRISRIEPGRVVLSDGNLVLADIVILSAGTRANTRLAREAGLKIGKTGVTVNSHMQTSDLDIYAVGDMVETYHRVAKVPSLLSLRGVYAVGDKVETYHRVEVPSQLALRGPANRQGRLAADHICGKSAHYRGNVGTSVCKIFDLTVASTGLSVKALRAMNQEPLWVTIHPPDHSCHYPGVNSMTLKVIFEKGTGRLLGAQAIGSSGIDKRIDVLSTALQARMRIFDLEHLELSYAPPYSSAKDAVNVAGFVGGNVLRGDVHIIHTENLEIEMSGAQIVDVRPPEEFNSGHVRGAVNLPIDTLRENVSTLEKGRRLIVYCQVGYRGYLAYRILKQKGFDVVNLDGGYKLLVNGVRYHGSCGSPG
jgi:NADPH-dependent 2,4-dienoyl-CoA reductase/sulfur reductase-like enzyme/rhodanese-related sulfurtransferase